MGYRLPRPTVRSIGSLLTGPGATALLAAALLVVAGPGVAASSVPVAPSDPSRPAAIRSDPVTDLAWKLDFDVDRLYRYVADEIRYEPYPGILRGAAGTLAAGAGNSVDKTLLLAALLDASQVDHRFARGPVDAAVTTRIVAAMTTDLDGARQAALDPLRRGAEEAPSASAAPGSDAPLTPEEEQEGEALATQGAQRFEIARSRVQDTVSMLSAAIDEAGVTLPTRDHTPLPQAEITDHTWLEVRSGPSWIGLDPTLPDMAPGDVLTTAAETIDQLPDDLRYGVRFDVLVERVQGDQLVTDTVLTQDGYADQLAGQPIEFGHITPSSFKRLGLSLNSLLGDGWIDYRPTLDIGTGSVIADASVGIPVSGGSTDIFGTEASPGAGPAEGEATAEWLEITVTPPGSEPQVARRTVFDRVPADVRYGGTPTIESVRPIALVDLDGSGTADFPPMRGVKEFAIATGATGVVPPLAPSDDGLGLLAATYHRLRDAVGADIALEQGARTFLDGPNIVSVSVDIDPDATAADFRDHVRFGLDIWHRSHGVLPLTGSSSMPGTEELVAGVADHVAERFALEMLADDPAAPPDEIGVGPVFEAAAAQGIPTIVLRGAVPGVLPYSPQATESIKAAVAAGQVLVIPAEPVALGGAERIGWWAIDPVSGATSDRMDDGSGTAATEEAHVIKTRLGQIRCYGSLGLKIGLEIAWVVNVQLLNIKSLNTLSQLRRARQMGLCD